MVWEIGKPQRILKGTCGFVYKVRNAHRPTIWRHRVYSSMRNVMNSIYHRVLNNGDNVCVYDASTLELVSLITIRHWRLSEDVSISRADIDAVDEKQADNIRGIAGEYEGE